MKTEVAIILIGSLLLILSEIVRQLNKSSSELNDEVDDIVESLPCMDEEDTCKFLGYNDKKEEWFCRKCMRSLK